MHSLLVWKLTRPPNYKTNIGRGYPYSEVPFIDIVRNNSENREVTFKLFNAHYDMYLKLDASTDDMGDRQAWGSKNSEEESESLAFYIINVQYRQGLKLVAQKDSYGDRLLMGTHARFYSGLLLLF
ncbi:unnamed protein product [Arctia plantaginis]|uniref:Uncharacterized protein n=1 Tax=Arctia plantaginis TaxID=874455 RepID=A0A8S1AF61_ARCPL|nr:unnamed protein product [Arctia plantaginis]